MSTSTKTKSRSKIVYKLSKYDDTNRPLITDAKWGNVVVSYLEEVQSFKDVIIWPTGYKNWNWTLTDTHHSPGIQIPEIKELVEDYDCDYIILSTGFEDVLNVDPATVAWLNKHKIKYEIMNSIDAIHAYNMNDEANVGLLLHSTC